MLIEFNTFQNHSADSISTNTYLMSAAAVFQKLLVKVDVDLMIYDLIKKYQICSC